ncbi:MAG: GNAT family N-acetyltransferase [Faecalimonas sp.]|nr:GNAT family N-acetyltransferase [Faecalimonas sp.]
MKLRKLKREEHNRTRALWEAVFPEDTPAFLDYYYAVKAQENEIYVIEKDGEIVSMLHLNPYPMWVGEQMYEVHYIVAVATDPRYRRRGYMASLLNYALRVMKERGEPFTFLMPAKEEIYKPFGFSFIYEQQRGKVGGKNHEELGLTFAEAAEDDCAQIASFANEMLEECDIVTWRDIRYYQTLLKEQKSEDGGILLAKNNEELVGVFCYAKAEKGYEFREPLCTGKEILEQAIFYLTKSEEEQVFCTGYGEETKPMIMAKVLHPELVGDLQNKLVFLNEVV